MKRVVSSTLAGETLSLSGSLAELEWLQVMYRDIIHNDVDPTDWFKSTGPFAALLRDGSTLNNRQESTVIVDAKSVFDTLTRNCSGSKEDKRCAIKQSLSATGSVVHWVPHWAMPAGVMTKSDITKGNYALENLLRTGQFRLLNESHEMATRAKSKHKTGRSKQASADELSARASLAVRTDLAAN